MLDTRPERLINELAMEKERFRSRGQCTLDHEYAIKYLSTGEVVPPNPEDYELLDAVMNDLETTYVDYQVH